LTSGPKSNSFALLSELERLQNGGRPLQANSSGSRSSTDERRFADIIKEKPLKVTIRVLVPVKEHPKVSVRGVTPALYAASLRIILRLRVLAEILQTDYSSRWLRTVNVDSVVELG
jgi:hypothetical protein